MTISITLIPGGWRVGVLSVMDFLRCLGYLGILFLLPGGIGNGGT